MKILSWNCRGFRKATAVQRCKQLVNKNKPDIIFLSETKVSVNVACKPLVNLGFSSFVGTDAINSGGGTTIAWLPFFSVEILELSPHVCHCKVSRLGNSFSCYLSFVYGPPNSSDHHLLWDWFQYISITTNLPWLIVGDFNQIYSFKDKSNSKGKNIFFQWYYMCSG